MLSARLIAALTIFLASGTPAFSAELSNPHLLPSDAAYARNARCAPIELHLPESKHWANDGNLICPYPPDMPLSQGDTGICFAYSTADMISQRIGSVVSPLDVATKYYFADPSRLKSIADALLQSHIEQSGDIREVVLQSRVATDVSRVRNPARYPYFDKLEGGEEDVAALLYNIDGFCEDRDLPSYDGYSFFSDYFIKLRALGRIRPQPMQSYRGLAATAPGLRSPVTDSFNAAWVRHVADMCHRKPLPVPLAPVIYRAAANQREFMRMAEEGRPPAQDQVDRMFSMIDYALDHERAPAIGYSFWLFEDRAPGDPDVTADHSSVVIGRRRIEGTCQYRIQDNTGEYCSRMRPGISARCENGRIWVTEDELQHSLYSVTYLR